MAQVPNYGGPQVMPSILGYRPMSTEIPKVPEMDVQKPLAKASAKLDDWYSKFLAEQDDARVTEALTELRRKAIDMESGEGGWASQLGANALEPDLDGKGLVERMDSGLQDYGQELASGLTARQQKMFGEKAQAIYTASYSGVSQHVYQQAIAQKKAAHEGAIAQAVESGAAYAGKPDMLAQSAHAIHESADKLAEFMGWTAENKALYIKKNMSSMYMNGIDSLLAGSDRNPAVAYQALGLLRAHSKEMLGSDVARARQRINPIVQAHEDRLKIERYTAGLGSAGEVLRGGLSEAVQRGVVTQDFVKTARGYDALTSITSDGGHQSVTTKEGAPAEWKHGASQLTVEQGMEAAKAANQPWDPEAFKTDRNYNDMLGVARYNDMLTEFADEHMAMAGYITSKETVREAEKQAQEKGGVWTDYLPEKAQSTLKSAVANMRREKEIVDEATGSRVSAFSPQYAAAAKTWPTPDQIREDLRRTDPRAAADPLYCDELVTKAWALVNQKKQSYVQEQNNVKAQISNILFKTHGDLSQVPQELMARLDVNEAAEVQKLAAHYQSDTFASDPRALGKLSDDRFLVSMSEDELTLYLNQLNGKDRQRILTRYFSLKQGSTYAADDEAARKRLAAMGVVQDPFVISSETIERALKRNPEYVKLREQSPEIAALYMAQMQEVLSLDGQELGKKLNEVEVNQRIYAKMREITPISELLGSTNKVASMLTMDDLPNHGMTDAYKVVEQTAEHWLKQIGQDRKPTKQEMQYVLTKIMLGDQRLRVMIPPSVSFDEPLMKKIDTAWKAKHGNSPMPQVARLRYYLMARAGGQVGEGSTGPSWLGHQTTYMYGFDDGDN